jgi:hypothetical protein
MGFVAPSHTERTIREMMDKAGEDAGSGAEVKATKSARSAAHDEVKTTKASSKATAVKDDKSQDDKPKA